jgi:hypothetical protein
MRMIFSAGFEPKNKELPNMNRQINHALPFRVLWQRSLEMKP